MLTENSEGRLQRVDLIFSLKCLDTKCISEIEVKRAPVGKAHTHIWCWAASVSCFEANMAANVLQKCPSCRRLVGRNEVLNDEIDPTSE